MMHGLITATFLLAAAWHAAASFYFLARSGPMLGAHTFDRPIAPVAIDMMQYLGAINLPFVAVSLIGAAAPPPLRAALLLTVSLANLSQFAKDLHAHASGRWKYRLLFITVVDGVFGFVMLGLAIYQHAEI
jgi:uncharacterized membrane protein